MKLPEHEREAHRAAFRAMSLGQKAEYIFAYYKLPIVLILIAVVAIGSVTHRLLTEKEALLYVAYVNVSLPEMEDDRLAEDFVQNQGANPRTSEVYRYRGLYLSEAEDSADHQMSYASRLKLLAAIDAEEVDVVIMNRDAYDLLSQSGYLLDLQDSIKGMQPSAAASELLETNVVVLDDNRVELELGEADTYEAATEQHANALVVTDLFAARGIELTDDVYLGIIANTPRLDTSLAYIAYLTEAA